MSLSKYKQKRKFSETPEPQGGTPDASRLRFVIQKHAASHLHYDFRLEMEGVLKSWAVPKGPSTDPHVKRLAMMVEDHPYDYRTFEGIIPEGNYDAGTVMVWDEGFYEPADTTKSGNAQKSLLHQLHSGRLKFVLHGKKLKGEYALVKTSARGENAWLLMKASDKYASEEDIILKDKSVISKKTLDGIARTSNNVHISNRSKDNNSPKKTAVAKQPTTAKTGKKSTSSHEAGANTDKSIQELLAKGEKKGMPQKVSPMLATLVDKPFNEEGWIYEVKWDGYRALAMVNGKQVDIFSRNNKSFNEKYYPLYNELKKWNIQTVVDGEIVIVDEKGMANFSALQNWRSEADGQLFYYVFDMLWINGVDITALPLSDRKQILKYYLPAENEIIKLSENFDEDGISFFKLAEKLGLEGIMAKKADSEYIMGDRSKEWLKIKTAQRQEVIIGGYTNNEGSAKPFSSLLVGVYKNKKLQYTGKIGTGFSVKKQQEMMKQFKTLQITKCPFEQEPDVNKPSRFRPNPPDASVTWLKPQLVCEVSFREMTSDGVMRHPSFEGMRDDKAPNEVVHEKEIKTENVVHEEAKRSARKVVKAPGKQERKTLLNPSEETQSRKINGHELKFTNLSKIYWPESNVSKRDMLNYYYQVAPYMLPYMKDRPQTLNRHPNGIKGKTFYQKDVTGKVPDWIETFAYFSEADNRKKNFLVCGDEASLIYIASLGCIEMNPWSSRTNQPDNPDWCIIDLDPDKNTFEQVIKTAQITKEVLDAIDAPCCCKTSGSTGLHIYIPLDAKYTYEQSKEFARAIATIVHHQTTKFTSIERATANRQGKMYIDFLQNRPQATLAAPYSLRPKPGATVSMPLHWDEVKKGLKMKDFTIFNAIERVKSEGDLFKPVLGKGINLKSVIKKMESVFG